MAVSFLNLQSSVRRVMGVLPEPSASAIAPSAADAALLAGCCELAYKECDDTGALADVLLAAFVIAAHHRVPIDQSFSSAGISPDFAAHCGGATGDRRSVLAAPAASVRAVLEFYGDASMTSRRSPAGTLAASLPALLAATAQLFDCEQDVLESFAPRVSGDVRESPMARLFSPPDSQAARRFGGVQRNSPCPYAPRAFLWAPPEYDPARSFEQNMEAAVPTITNWMKLTWNDGCDGFIFAFPTNIFGSDLDSLARLFRRVMEFLDVIGEAGSDHLDAAAVSDPSWRCLMWDEQLFMSMFAPCYGPGHSRQTYGCDSHAFIMLQPDTAVHRHLPEDDMFDERLLRVRRRFDEELLSYRVNPLEADRFVFPLDHSQPPVRWYEHAS